MKKLKNDNILHTRNDNIQAFKKDKIYTRKNDNILYTGKWKHSGIQKKITFGHHEKLKNDNILYTRKWI